MTTQKTAATPDLYPAGSIVLGDRVVMREAVMDRASRLARSLSTLGVGEDDRVAILMRNDVPFVETATALARLGAYAVPLNWHLTPPELESVLRDSGAKIVVCHHDLYPLIAPVLGGRGVIVAATPALLVEAYRVADPTPPLPDTAIPYETLMAADPWDGSPAAVRSSIIYTSGTTGAPKGVVREPCSPAMAQRVLEVMSLGYGLDGVTPIRTVVTGPMYHSVPNVYALTAIRAPGSMVILQPRFDARALLRLIESQRITHLHLVPTMFVRLLKLPKEEREAYDLSSLRFVAHGAAPCPPDVKRQMIDWWGPVIHEYYGASETGPAIIHGSEEALRKPGTVGKPVPWAVVKVLDDDGNTLPPGEVGHIYMRIDGYPQSHYLNNPEASAAIKRDGLTTAGEMGYMDADGYVFLTGRAKEMIVSGGVNIFPIEIESAVLSLPGVHDCAVFGVPDPEFGEAVCAYIEPDAGRTLTAEGVRDGLRDRLARYKVPSRIVFRSALPRQDSGKVLKRVLLEDYLETV
jgi:long-chain acyl-CoA synthetase